MAHKLHGKIKPCANWLLAEYLHGAKRMGVCHLHHNWLEEKVQGFSTDVRH